MLNFALLQEIHTKGIMNTAYDVFSDDSDRGLSPQRFKHMLKSLKGVFIQFNVLYSLTR